MFKKNSKIFLFAGLFIVALLSLAFISSKNQKPVVACEDGCVSTGPQCGTDNGQREVLACPAGYEYHQSSHHPDCKKAVYELKCPTDWRDYTSSNSSKPCKMKVFGYWKYADKESVFDHYDYADQVTTYEECHTGRTQYDGCEPEGQCPTECGLEASEIPDGKGGYIQCPATEECHTPTPEVTPTPTPEQPVGGCVGCGPVGVPTCNDTKPAAATLLSVIYLGNNQVKVTWQKVVGANDYSIYYGPTSGNYLYSVPSTGDTDNFIINGMTGGFYMVTSINGCQPGDPSNELELGGVGGQVLGASTMAGTGTFAENLATFIAVASLALIGLGTKKVFSK